LPDPPTPSGQAGLRILRSWKQRGSILGALEAMHAELGDAFRLSLPGTRAVMVAGPQLAHQVLVSQRASFQWRNATDPVTHLLRRGVLVTDGPQHDQLRALLEPSLQRRTFPAYQAIFLEAVDAVTAEWRPGQVVDMLVEMRKVALRILVGTLFGADIGPDLPRLVPSVLRMLAYISPGLWLLAPALPRPGYQRALAAIDDYLYGLIAARRAHGPAGEDLLSTLVARPELGDDTIRDQLLTMFIAGHDTSTALLAWTLYLLGSHPVVMQRVREECAASAGEGAPGLELLPRLTLLEAVLDESLRLYPPIHVANRLARHELALGGFRIAQGTRVMLSIYLTHRDPKVWREPHAFRPERFVPGEGETRTPFAYLPFGGGPRNCIGAAFGKAESSLVLAHLMQTHEFELVETNVRPHMGATLEPRPGVRMRVSPLRGRA
jgi:cytochrome P450